MSGLNEHHKRRLQTTFQSIDESLSKVLHLLDTSEAQSPFSTYAPDATPVQARVVADYIARLRSLMRQILDTHDIPPPPRTTGSIWAARTQLMTVEIAIEELLPQYMRGYGELSGEARQELALLVSQLTDVLGRMEAYLAQGSARDLTVRLQQLAGTTQGSRLLQDLERVITSRGLVEFRPTLEMLAQRLESSTFEVAVFGKVSSGKSSLLDYILQTNVLPIGVTPVTAIPTRIVYGPAARAVVSFAEAASITVDPRQLIEFVTEQQNPGNAKHVTKVVVELPAERIREGIAFVDTPGVGSLAASGGAESLAYLPRCDLGLVLVDASTSLAHEDIALADSLYRSGADVMVLLSKGDVLAPADRSTMAQYVSRQMQANLGMDVPVHLVSVKDDAASLCDQWVSDVLLPRLQEHRQLAATAIHRKIETLRGSVVAALRKRLDRSTGVPTSTDAARWQETDRVIAAALARLDQCKRHRPDSLDRPAEIADRVLDEASRAATDTWNGQHDAHRDIGGVIAAALDRACQQIAGTVVIELQDIRHELAEALGTTVRATGTQPEDHDELPEPRGVPLPDPLGLQLVIRKPLLAGLSQSILYRHIHRQSVSAAHQQLVSNVRSYAKRLEDWRSRALDDVGHAFTRRADLLRARLRTETALVTDTPEDLKKDLSLLQRQ